MAQKIPIFKDDLSFAERQSRVWSDMERDLERRRREWEDEIERMRKDFFTLKPSEDGRLDKLSDKFKMGGELMDEARGVIEKDQNGQPVFRARFNVNSYKPDEVAVKIDSNKLVVHAKHEEKADNKSVSREYSREIDIPRELDPLALQCSISTDGILTVEAPMPSQAAIKDNGRGAHASLPITHAAPQQGRKEHMIQTNLQGSVPITHGAPPPQPPPMQLPQQQMHQQQQLHQQQQQHQQQAQKQGNPNVHSSTFTTFLSGAPTSQGAHHPVSVPPPPQQPPPPQHQASSGFSTVHDSDRKFKVDVDIEDFAPEELTVKTVDKRLVISARREEVIGNRTSTKELNREIYLPETVDPYAVKAYFSDSGKLFVEAPYVKSVPISHYGEGFSNLAGR